MLNSLQAASRLLVRASLALFTVVVLLLIQSAFWSTRVSGWMQFVILATALLSYFRPQYGLLTLAALVPLGRVGSGALDSQMRGAEALVLAFLAGALVRGWTLREFRTFPSTRLEMAALIFGFIVVASCAEQLWFFQIQRDFPMLFGQELLTYASRNYITSFRGFGMIFRAMLLLEGIALLLYTIRYARAQQAFGEHLLVSLALGAIGTALLTIWYVFAEFSDTGQSLEGILNVIAQERWRVHVGDVNAAGSFFAMAMFLVFGFAVRDRRFRLAWSAGGLLLAIALWLTFSRTALLATALMMMFLVALGTVGRFISWRRTVALTATASVTAIVAAWRFLPAEYFGAGAVTAVRVRWLFLGTTWRMLLDYPFFGVGIGQYALWSYHFAAPEMFEYYQRENAHNNFAQIAGELGLVGLAAFLTVLTFSVWRRSAAASPQGPLLLPLLSALAVFILTWLGGHPLLVPEVAFPFWIALGLAASLLTSGAVHTARAGVAAGVLGLLLLSIPPRIAAKAATLDMSGVRYGLSLRQIMTSRARFFVPHDRAFIEVPLRARNATDTRPVQIDVLVDDSPVESITLTGGDWRRERIELAKGGSRRFRQIDLRIRQADASDDIDDARRDSVEVGNWEIISKPNG